MKKSELKQLIREEYKTVLGEVTINPMQFKHENDVYNAILKWVKKPKDIETEKFLKAVSQTVWFYIVKPLLDTSK